MTVSRRSRDRLTTAHDRSATFFKIFPICLKHREKVVWQSLDGRVTSDDCCPTVQRLLSKIFRIAWNLEKKSFDSWPTVGVTSDDCHVTLQRLLSKFFRIAWNVKIQLFDSRPTVAWPPTTVAWPFRDFFQNSTIFAETSKYNCLTVSRRSRYLRRLSRYRSTTYFKILRFLLKCRNTIVWQSADGRVTSDHRRVTVQQLFLNFCHFCWNVEIKLFDNRPMVAWPPTIVAWPFSDFFWNFAILVETSK